MSAIIISILVNVLGAFLSALFKKWFGGGARASQNAAPELVASLTQAKPDFLARVRWRVWLGPKRLTWASSLYDLAQTRLASSLVHLSTSPDELSTFCTDGLAALTPEELAPSRKELGPGAHRYKLLQNGLVKSGFVAYSVDQNTGVINYEAAIIAGKWFLTKTYNFSGSYRVDPALLNPKTLQAGRVITVGKLRMRVRSIGQTTVMVGLSVEGQEASGTAILGTTGPVLMLCTMDATATISGFTITLGVRQV